MSSAAEDPFKAIVWDNLEAGVLAWIFAEAPYLAWGPLRWIVTEIVTLVMDKAYELGKKAWNWEKVEFLVDLHRSQYEKAALHLKVIGQEYGPDTPQFKEARDADKAALARFLSFNP